MESSRLDGLSSITRIRFRSCPLGRSPCKGRVTVKVAPRPSWLSTLMVPPCSPTILLTRASPSPVPSYGRSAEDWTWKNSLKISSWCCGSMPIPLSLTWSTSCPARGLVLARTRAYPPSGVNLMALASRL